VVWNPTDMTFLRAIPIDVSMACGNNGAGQNQGGNSAPYLLRPPGYFTAVARIR
jgi:hypothetical protein